MTKLSKEMIRVIDRALNEYENLLYNSLYNKTNKKGNQSPAEDPFYLWSYRMIDKELECINEARLQLLEPEDLETETE